MSIILAVLAVLCFAIGALIAFTSLNGISVLGLALLGLFFWTLYSIAPERYGPSWNRRA